MFRVAKPIIATLTLFSPAAAETYSCLGTQPSWQLAMDDNMARFVFPAPTEMDILLITTAENRDWPKAYTLIGDRDTAVVVLDSASCNDSSIRAHVLTQRAEQPIMLTGCCTVAE